MPRVVKRKLQKKSTISKRKKHRAGSIHARSKRSSSKGVSVPDTFESWIEKQAKSRKYPMEVRLHESLKMPRDTMDDWLGRQTFVEVEKRSESTLPQDTTELWLQAQVSKRQSLIENVENDGGTIASSPSGTIQVYSEASQEGTLVESTPTTKSESSS
jgi:hypothetical protein